MHVFVPDLEKFECQRIKIRYIIYSNVFKALLTIHSRCVIIVNNYIKKETYERRETRFCVFKERLDIKR